MGIYFNRLVGELCHLFTSYLVKRKESILGVKIMAQAADKIRSSETQLTAVHSDLCQLSLCAKVFNLAIDCLDLDITSIASTEVSMQHRNLPLSIIAVSFNKLCRTVIMTPNIFYFITTTVEWYTPLLRITSVHYIFLRWLLQHQLLLCHTLCSNHIKSTFWYRWFCTERLSVQWTMITFHFS